MEKCRDTRHICSWFFLTLPGKILKTCRQKLSFTEPLVVILLLGLVCLVFCLSYIQPEVVLYIPEPFIFTQSPRDVQSGNLRDEVANKPKEYGSERVEQTLAKNINSADGEKLKVVVLSHSHVDPGWLVTFEQYYKDKTEKILNNIVNYLEKEPTMKMIWSEISFLQRWWDDATVSKKNTFKKLIANGQLEITGGGWVMTDEASPYYWATIDNLITGHQFLNDEMSVHPSSAWSNDPFGHGATVPYLMKLSGVNATTIDRVDGKVKASMRENQQIIFNWRQHWDNSRTTDCLVHLLPYFYTTSESCGPYMYKCCAYDYGNSGFCPMKPITQQNIDEASNEIGQIYRKLATYTGMPVLLVILGNDFRFLQASEWEGTINNYQLLFKRLNEKHNFDINFGTLTEFFDAVRHLADKEPIFKSVQAGMLKPSLPILSGDFFPNWDQKDVYWTSYFVTHMFGKRLDRIIQSELRSTDIMIALLSSKLKDEENKISKLVGSRLETAHRNLALFQHHDAITGTSRTAVMDDYYTRLDTAWKNMKDIQAMVMNTLILGRPLEKLDASKDLFHSILTRTNPRNNFEPSTISLGDFADKVGKYGDIKPAKPGRRHLVTVFNSMPLMRQLIVRLRVDSPYIDIYNLNTSTYSQFQLNPVISADGTLQDEEYEVVFEVLSEPLAIAIFEIKRRRNPSKYMLESLIWTSDKRYQKRKTYHLPVETMQQEHAFIGVEQLKATISLKNGQIENMVTDGRNYTVSTEFWTYNQAGGQYIMQASGPTQFDHEVNHTWKVDGPISTDFYTFYKRTTVRTVFTSVNVDPPFRYSKTNGPIYMHMFPNMTGSTNSLLTLRLATEQFDVPSKHQYYSDSNGFQLFPRRYLPDVALDGNLFPTGAAVLVQNNEHRLNVLTAQPHGVSRLGNGRLELLLDEVVSANDDKGIEAGHHKNSLPSHQIIALSFERLSTSNTTNQVPFAISLRSHQIVNSLLYPAVVSHSNFPRDALMPSRALSPLLMPLPCQLQLLNMRPISGGQFLVIIRRVPNDPALDQDQVKGAGGCFLHQEQEAVDSFFESLGVSEIVETTLTGTKVINTAAATENIPKTTANMAIRTFKVRFGGRT